MWKLIKKTTQRKIVQNFDYKPLYMVIFAVAMALKLKPKDVVKHLNNDKASAFAKETTELIQKKMFNDAKKAQKELDKI